MGLLVMHAHALFRQLILLSAFAVLLFPPCGFAEEPHTIAVVVSSKADLAIIKQLTPPELSLIYWRKKQYWQGGVRIHPVNLHAEHPLRLDFSKAVLGSTPADQSDYWNGLYFHGTTPPYSLQSEEAALRYVATTKGAIAYVDACKIDESVKAILWINKGKVRTTAPEELTCTNARQ